MTVWRGHARGLVATAAAAALIGAGAIFAFADPSAPTGTMAMTRNPAPPKSSSPPVEAGRSTTPASRPAFVEAARKVAGRNAGSIHATAGEKYRAKDVVVDKSGARHVRFDRTWNGLAVLGGDFVVHSTAKGKFTGATVAQEAPIAVSAKPVVAKAAAIRVAEQQFTGRRGAPTTARLVVDAFEGKPALAWEATVVGADASSRLAVVVDAATGAVRRTEDQVHTADDATGRGLHSGAVRLSTKRTEDGGFELTDPDRGGATTRDAQNRNALPTLANTKAFTDADDVWGNGAMTDRATVGVDVHYGVAQTWDYLKETFGRAGIAGDGRGVAAYAHHDVDKSNASWSDYCRCMMFGDGSLPTKPFTSVDIVAHEMAHGFTSATAGLTYSGESGGLNEATSDIIGTLVEFAAGNPADAPDYLIGEKIEYRPLGDPLRWMDEPNKDGKSASCWSPTVKDLNVHYSSGIANKFFYSLAVGSGTTPWGTSAPCGQAAPAVGIGNDAAAAIWYRAVTAYMVSNTNFSGAREATLQAAADLYGAGSDERARVQAAWLAVGVDGTDGVPPAPIAPVVDELTFPNVLVGSEVEHRVTGRDPQRQPITFSSPNLPPGLTMSPDGVISGVAATKDQYVVTIVATDPDGNTGQRIGIWYVKGPPKLTSPLPGSRTFNVGAEVSFSVSFNDGADFLPDGSATMTLTATGLPDGLTLTVGPPSLGLVTATVKGTPTAVGSGTIQFTATDPDGQTATAAQPFVVQVSKVPAAPVSFVTGGDGSALVDWDDPQPGGPAITGYVVRLAPGGTEQTLPATARSVTLTGLDISKAYTVGVRARSAAGDSPEKVSTLVPTELPLEPLSLIAGYADPVTLTGTVIRQGAGRIAGAEAYLEQKPYGSTAWSRVTTVKTDIDGAWSHTVNPTVITAYRVTFPPGSYGQWPATSATSTITVRYAVTVKASATTTTANTTVTFTGTVKPATPGVLASLQRYTDGEWVTIQSTPITAAGNYSIGRAFARGAWNLRVVASGGGTNAYGFTSALKLTVT